MIEINLLKDSDDDCSGGDTQGAPSAPYYFYCGHCGDWHPWGKCDVGQDAAETGPKSSRGLRTLYEFLGEK
jgi:hypothetical protein